MSSNATLFFRFGKRGIHMAQKQSPGQPSVQELIAKSSNKKQKKIFEKIIPIILLLIASVSVLTTFGIVLTL